MNLSYRPEEKSGVSAWSALVANICPIAAQSALRSWLHASPF